MSSVWLLVQAKLKKHVGLVTWWEMEQRFGLAQWVVNLTVCILVEMKFYKVLESQRQASHRIFLELLNIRDDIPAVNHKKKQQWLHVILRTLKIDHNRFHMWNKIVNSSKKNLATFWREAEQCLSPHKLLDSCLRTSIKFSLLHYSPIMCNNLKLQNNGGKCHYSHNFKNMAVCCTDCILKWCEREPASHQHTEVECLQP